MTLAFTKMQACGNDFIVVDDRNRSWDGRESALARQACDRHFGVGADGLLVLRSGRQPGHLGMVFVNADGLVGEMCGNGARCLASFARRAGLVEGAALMLETQAGGVQVSFDEAGLIRLDLPLPGPLRDGIDLTWQGQSWHFDAIDVGPPHVVCFIDRLETLQTLDVVTLGRLVREHPAFAPRGCNVNFVVRSAPDTLRMRTYERGVEGETLGCGTGASACAVVGHEKMGMPPRLTVLTQSGEPVWVQLAPDKGLMLSGHATFVADGLFDSTWVKRLQGSTPA